MGKNIRKEAEKLGLKNQQHTVLYARPREIRVTFSKHVPDAADAIRDYIAMKDSNMEQDRSGGGRTNTFYYLASSLKLYVEVIYKAAFSAANRTVQINIYTENEDYIRGIANAVNTLWADVNGLLANMIWPNIEKNFKVKKEDCIAEWNKWLK